MKTVLKALAFLLVCIFLISSASAAGFSQDGDAIEKAADSVLQIAGIYANNPDMSSFGSGFVAFNNKTLITNYHVIDGLMGMLAWDDDDKEYAIKYILCADKEADIAILEIEESTNLQPLELYPDNNLKRGSPVVAIGSPSGGGVNTVTTGVISSQRINDEGYPEIQISASITHGSSGGALFNDDGKVIGVTSSGVDGVDINFAINIAVAQAMYNAWDGTRYTFSNFKDTAKMDFTGVYDHSSQSVKQEPQNTEQPDNGVVGNAQESTTWTCPNCGSINTDLFCQECGTEKPSWICVCGKSNSGKFCGSCGRKAEELIDSINLVFTDMSEHKYLEAIGTLEQLGEFESGSFSTSKGTHIKAKDMIPEAYYEWGMYLVSTESKHEDIIACFEKAGTYGDAKKQIKDENDRYYENLCIFASNIAEEGDYEEAIRLLDLAKEYVDTEENIKKTYYLWGCSLLNAKDYEGCRDKFKNAGEYLNTATMISQSYYLEGLDYYSSFEYQSAINAFEMAGDYQDVEEQILASYYALGQEALENNQVEKAKEYFIKASGYNDAKDQVAAINNMEKEKIYIEASDAMALEDYEKAKELYISVSGYKDADELAVSADISYLRNNFESFKNDKDVATYSYKFLDIIEKLKKYENVPEGVELSKEIYYFLGERQYNIEYYKNSYMYFTLAGDYLDAPNKSRDAKEKYYNQLIAQEKYEAAYAFYKETLLSSEPLQERVMMQIGDDTDVVSFVLNLIRRMGINKKIKAGESLYKQDYLSSVIDFEQYYGLNADGQITLSEYIFIKDIIYPGTSGEDVKNLLEKLADLSYLGKLPNEHSTYEDRYISGVKKAEMALGLSVDGIITKDEYNTIMSQKVISPVAPANLDIKIKNDMATISWSKVEGALKYDVYCGTVFLGSTDKTSWVQKNIKTGITEYYKVKAVKYTVDGIFAVKTISIPQYYIPINIKKLRANADDYIDQFVELRNMKFISAEIYDPDGNYLEKTDEIILKAKNTNGYLVFVFCYSGVNGEAIEIVIDDYKAYLNKQIGPDIIGKKRNQNISVRGKVIYIDKYEELFWPVVMPDIIE